MLPNTTCTFSLQSFPVSHFNTKQLKGLLPHTDAGLFLWEFGAFCSTFLLNFFNIQFLLFSLLLFWLYFSQCWNVWTFLSSPLTALVCYSFFLCSYLLYLEWNLLLRRSLWDLLFVFCLIILYVLHFWHTSVCCFLVHTTCWSLLSFFLSPFIAREWALFSPWARNSLVIFSFVWAWRNVIVEWSALVFFSNLLFMLIILFKSAVRVLQ